MYAIISKGSLIGFVEKIPYVKYKESSKSYSTAKTIEEAVGIAYNGQQYAYNGLVPYEGAPEAHIIEADNAKNLFESLTKSRQNESDLADVDSAVVDLAGVTDEHSEAIAGVEDAVLELAEVLANQ